MLAVRQGSYDMVSTLIICGAFVEQVCLKKWMAIHEAAKVSLSYTCSLVYISSSAIYPIIKVLECQNM